MAMNIFLPLLKLQARLLTFWGKKSILGYHLSSLIYFIRTVCSDSEDSKFSTNGSLLREITFPKVATFFDAWLQYHVRLNQSSLWIIHSNWVQWLWITLFKCDLVDVSYLCLTCCWMCSAVIECRYMCLRQALCWCVLGLLHPISSLLRIPFINPKSSWTHITHVELKHSMS